MKKYLCLSVSAFLISGVFATSVMSEIDPDQDKQDLWNYFNKKYSEIETDDFINGNYVFDQDLRDQQEADEDFPIYEELVEKGQEQWEKPFANGKTYASCFNVDVTEIRAVYPYYDEKAKKVQTLESAINDCRTSNGEKALKWKKGPIAILSAYLAFEGRENDINPVVDTAGAMKSYAAGRQLFYSKRGQLNMSCADCHVYNAGKRARANVLSSVIGQVSHFPVYRKKWSGLGTLHRRYEGCQKNIRAQPYKAQSNQYRDLELFHTYMSKGLKWNGPQIRG